MLKKVFDFILVSSKDPRAVSLTVKGLIVGIIPYLMQANDIVCQFGHQCISFHPTFMETLTDTLVGLVYYGLWVVATVWTLYGIGRKAVRTLQGNNKSMGA